MPRKSILSIIICAFVLSLPLRNSAQAENSSPKKDILKVGVAGSEPFVIKADGQDNYNGIVVDIWDELAENKNWVYEYKSFNSVDKALKAVEKGRIDLAIGPISITAKRVERLRFSQPYYPSSLAIASRTDDVGLWDRIKPFFSLKLLIAVGVFLFILAIVGTLLWLAEHKASPEQFPSDPVKGIGNGMWLAIVTMSTTGYGDMAPITLRGRIVAGVWMVITIIFATSMVAGIASTLTLSGLGSSTITNIEELSGKKTATVAGSPAVSFIKEHKSKVVSAANLDAAMTLLKEKEVDAVIYDRPQLLYYQENNQKEEIYIAKAEYYKQGYGFAFPLNTDLVNEVNLILLELAEKQEIEEIVNDYLGKDE